MGPRSLRVLGLGALALLAAIASAQNRYSSILIDRVLMDIRLGSSLSALKKTFPPTSTFPKHGELNGGVERIYIRRYDCRTFPLGVDVIRLELVNGSVVAVKAVFDIQQTNRESLEIMVRELSQKYGEPFRDGMTYRWRDERTLLSAYDEQIPSTSKKKRVELRTAIELLDLDGYPRPPEPKRKSSYDTIYRRLIGGY